MISSPGWSTPNTLIINTCLFLPALRPALNTDPEAEAEPVTDPAPEAEAEAVATPRYRIRTDRCHDCECQLLMWRSWP